MAHKVVLYNPKAVFYTMPLALLAVASYLDPKKYQVVIIDGRVEKNAGKKVLEELKDAVCFGVTVLTGAPILDALEISRLVKQNFPELPVVWGGWHPSLFPSQTLEQSPADIIVNAQGEITFNEVLEKLTANQSLEGIEGISFKSDGKIISNPDRHFTDINDFPEINYGLIDANAYNNLSGASQLDYISSQGCRFRCHFCADPTVYNRGWYGYSPERIGAEIEKWQKQSGFNHVHFQDETFFTNTKRVAGIAEEFLERELPITWFGTMRADQGSRMDDALFALCKRSGLERVMIGVEAGSQAMLDWMQKDISIGQVFETAEKCRRHDIAINFSMIIGFPGETEESIRETLHVSRRLRAMSPEFRVSLFYFKPYPGNPIAEKLKQEGYQFPARLEDWAAFDFVGPRKNEWISEDLFEEIEEFKFYQRLAWSRPRWWLSPLQEMAKWRCNTSNYRLPVERLLIERLQPGARLS